MLVSKIKPCKSKYKRTYTVKLQMAHYISLNLFDECNRVTRWITVVILELIHAPKDAAFARRIVFIGYQNQTRSRVLFVDSQ